jgi:hypothetical protein
MTALNKCDPDRYPKARVEGSTVYAVRPFTFIDDLASFTCNRAHTQELARLVSAGHAIFGTKAADHKFRAITNRQDQGSITVYDHQWRPRAVQFEDASFMVKVLGVIFCLNGNWDDQVNEAIHAVRGYLKRMRH